ncbi:MAG: response regulator transcription factor [Acidobacteriota bacterium]
MTSPLRIIIVDDHPIFRQGLRQVIEKHPEFSIIGEANDGESAIALIAETQPDVVILDIDMPKMDGFEVVKQLKEKALSTHIIFLTMHKSEEMFNEALNLGVKGYVVKESAVIDILQGIKTVYAGEFYFSPQLMAHLINRKKQITALYKQKPSLSTLTATERKILLMISEQKTSRQIADELYISIRTVENHRNNICHKLHLKGTHSLVKFALDNKSELHD